MVKTLIALPILTNFTQHLVKIGLKLVLNLFCSLKLQNPRPGGGGGYSHIRTVRVCAARKPHAPPPICRTWLLYCLDVGHSKIPPFFKNIPFFVLLFRPGQIEKTVVLKKIYVSLLFLTPKSPVFPVTGRSAKRNPGWVWVFRSSGCPVSK